MEEKPVVKLFGNHAPRAQTMRWVLALLAGIVVVCTLLALSGCQALCKVGDQAVIDATGKYYASACR
jgi:hypothetical protein